MSVAVSCNLPDGVILGVDSAVTVPGGDNSVLKVYENAQKIFQLGDLPIGIASYGLAALDNRSLGSYLSEFENDVLRKKLRNRLHHYTVKGVTEWLREFFLTVFTNNVIPSYEKKFDVKFTKINDDEKPILGLIVAGFSKGSYSSEVWDIVIPVSEKKNSAVERKKPGVFGVDLYAKFDPISRYIKGFDPDSAHELIEYAKSLIPKENYTKEVKDKFEEILVKNAYKIHYDAMPIKEGLEHTKFLIQLVIGHHRYATGAPIVGGKIKMGKVSCKDRKFHLLEEIL